MNNDRRVILARSPFPLSLTPSLLLRRIGVVCAVLLAVASTVPGTMAAAESSDDQVKQQSGYYYTIQKGDTLWDLSRRFADKPESWPDLWQENRQIPNPHRIFPGERIRLYQKTWSDRLTPAEQAHPAAKAPAAAPEPPHFYYSTIDSVGFIRDTPVPPVAKIFKLPNDRTITGQWDKVYVRPEAGTVLLPGQRFHVYRTLDPIYEDEGKRFIGHQHFLLGVVEITAVFEELAEATIVHSFRAVHVGDGLMPYTARDPKVMLQPSAPGIEGRIVKAEENQTMLAAHSVAFIDRGASDGIRRGQQYMIYDPAGYHTETESQVTAQIPPDPYGTVLVLLAEDNAAAVLITRSLHDIPLGARIATPVEGR